MFLIFNNHNIQITIPLIFEIELRKLTSKVRLAFSGFAPLMCCELIVVMHMS